MPIGIDLESAAKRAAEVTVVAGTAWGAMRLAMGFGPWVDRRIAARLTPALALLADAIARQTVASDRQTTAIEAIVDDVGELGRAVARVEGVLGTPHCSRHRRANEIA